MKIFLIILSIMTILPFIGMFLTMLLVKNGTIKLSTNSWHYNYMCWMWDTNQSQLKNVCPYYWSVVLSIYILPAYLIIKYMADGIIYLIDLLDYLPKINIPEEKQKIFKKVYSSSKSILGWLMIIILGLVIITFLVGILISLYNITTLWLYIGILILFTLSLTYTIISITNEELANKIKNTLSKVFTPVFKTIKFPFSWIGTKILNLYVKSCPSIDWE